MMGINSTGKLSSVLYNNKKNLSPVLSILLIIPLLAESINVYPPSQGTNREKYSILYHIKVRNADSGRK